MPGKQPTLSFCNGKVLNIRRPLLRNLSLIHIVSAINHKISPICVRLGFEVTNCGRQIRSEILIAQFVPMDAVRIEISIKHKVLKVVLNFWLSEHEIWKFHRQRLRICNLTEELIPEGFTQRLFLNRAQNKSGSIRAETNLLLHLNSLISCATIDVTSAAAAPHTLTACRVSTAGLARLKKSSRRMV
jgi:hypothetical protein